MAWRSCSVLCRLTGGDPFLCSVKGGRWPGGFQQRCSFKKASRTPEPKQPEGPGLQNQAPAAPRPPAPPRALSRLVRPFLFTVGFSGCSFGAAAIWQYESLKSRVQSYFNELQADWLEKLRPQKRGDVRKEINQWWNSLTEGQKTVAGPEGHRCHGYSWPAAGMEVLRPRRASGRSSVRDMVHPVWTRADLEEPRSARQAVARPADPERRRWARWAGRRRLSTTTRTGL
uniref:Presenilin associated rhomboid like n=1 Tax=Poecilia reticulata TaxID=8081 RepID=A0A3P9N529_POERE